ncbi:hypothetical protein BJ878DRAFT_256001 [Calycina marina]|uniref:SET domain-containing protein n=1 Tax=Calycina marina TaxID=1763456 RepID=A0A9P8CIT3_9HELO|nr:hypothetical protein BJ878DRAFT_256001 [Calycina marina]
MPPSATHSSNPTQTHNEQTDSKKSEETLWRIDTIPGKGKGLFATQELAPGTLILNESPVVTTDGINSMETAEKDIARALRTKDKESQRAYLSLHNNFPTERKAILSNIIRSNGYPLGPNSEVGGVFLNISRCNHSCRPNAKHSWNRTSQTQTVYSLRTIAAGEEITLSYLSGGASKERQASLLQNFQFRCTCDLCSLPADELKASDARILRAKTLDNTIGNWDSARHSPGKVLANTRKLLDIYREEGIDDDRLANLYWDAFQVVIMHSDRARASECARRYVDLKILSEGPESANVEEVRPYILKPATQKSFGETKEWDTEVGDVPTELRAADFDKWLWRVDM